MGRPRKKNKHLPQRVYLRHGAYYYAPPEGPWRRLGKSYSDSLRALADILNTGIPVQTIEQLIARYEAEELHQKAEKTRKERRQQFKKLIEVFGHMRPESIEPHHVWNFWTGRGKTEQARHEIRALSALLTFARRIGARMRPNPCFGLRLPGGAARERYVTDEEFLLVRSVAQPMIRHAMNLALVAGLDQATIRRLEWRNFTDAGLEFERGKTRKLQLIKWNDDLRQIHRELKQEAPQLRRFAICNRTGKPYTLNGFQSQWRRAMTRAATAGLAASFHFHDLRAKSASDEKDDQTASDRLGHGDIKLTRRVYRRLPREAQALDVLNKLKSIEQAAKT